MTDTSKRKKMATSGLQKFGEIIDQSSVIEDGTPTRYRLKPRTDSYDKTEPYRKITFGEKDKNKPHKTILLVGETGTGKTKMINLMINYMLGVQREDKVWFEITDDQSGRTSPHSQTSIITVYGFYLQESQTDLTIIDTPGYGDTRGVEKDKEIARSLLSLSGFKDWVHKIDAVCLVIKATQNRLSDRQIYIFDAVQSLFGKDIVENIILFLTYSRGEYPKNALTAVEEAKFQCAVNEQNQPVFFLFDNCQGETFHEEYQMVQEQSWNLSFKGITGFFKFLDNIKPKSLQMSQDVLHKQKQLEAEISKIQSNFQEIDIKQNELKKAENDLANTIEEYEVKMAYKKRVDIDLNLAYEATCCQVCKENCHYPGCWWVRNLSWCTMMKDNHCTVCPKKCHYSKHVKEAKIYQTNNEKKKKYEDMIKGTKSLIKKLEEKLEDLKTQKMKLVIEAFHCVETLQLIALNTDSLLILLHVDFLIEKLKEINEHAKAEILENIKKRTGEKKNGAMKYMKMPSPTSQ